MIVIKIKGKKIKTKPVQIVLNSHLFRCSNIMQYYIANFKLVIDEVCELLTDGETWLRLSKFETACIITGGIHGTHITHTFVPSQLFLYKTYQPARVLPFLLGVIFCRHAGLRENIRLAGCNNTRRHFSPKVHCVFSRCI